MTCIREVIILCVPERRTFSYISQNITFVSHHVYKPDVNNIGSRVLSEAMFILLYWIVLECTE